MFSATEKALAGLSFLIMEYNRYRLKLTYDEENNPSLSLYRVRHKNAANEAFVWVKHIDITNVLEQCADFEEAADE